MGFTDPELEALLPLLKMQVFPKNAFLLREGEISTYAYFVEQGLLRSYSVDDKGKQHVIQFAPENWFISERSSAYFNEASRFNIEAIEETTVVVIDEGYTNYISALPAYHEKNEMKLQNHIRHLQNRISILLSGTAEEKYLEFTRLYPDVSLRVPQWMIASYLGITPESLSRVRKELAGRHTGPDL